MSTIAVACTTRRGIACVERVRQILPSARLHVVSAPEAPVEPRFVEDLEATAARLGATFAFGRRLDEPHLEPVWADPDSLLLMVSWRFLVPPPVLTRPGLGAWVVHDSLLPAYRGFSPTVWALAEGATETGATLFRAVPEVDAGPVAGTRPVPIGPDDTIAEVIPRVTEAYLGLLDRHLPALAAGTAQTTPQDEAAAFYRPRRQDADSRLHWQLPARTLHDLVRAVTRPYAGAWCLSNGRRLKVWRARPLPEPASGPPGTVLAHTAGGIEVTAGRGRLLLLEVDGPYPEVGQRLG